MPTRTSYYLDGFMACLSHSSESHLVKVFDATAFKHLAFVSKLLREKHNRTSLEFWFERLESKDDVSQLFVKKIIFPTDKVSQPNQP